MFASSHATSAKVLAMTNAMLHRDDMRVPTTLLQPLVIDGNETSTAFGASAVGDSGVEVRQWSEVSRSGNEAAWCKAKRVPQQHQL
jgi:hypothetical protein